MSKLRHSHRIYYRSSVFVVNIFGFVQLYRMHGNVVHLAISADASCRGLISPTNGPVRTELTEGKCVFDCEVIISASVSSSLSSYICSKYNETSKHWCTLTVQDDTKIQTIYNILVKFSDPVQTNQSM